MGQLTLLPLIRRWWRVVGAAGLLASFGGYLLVSLARPTYEANVQLLTGPINTDINTLRASGELARTYAELATTRPLLDGVSAEVDIEGGADELRPRVRATASSVSRLVTVFVKDESPSRAATTAETIGRRLLDVERQSSAESGDKVEELLRRREVAELPAEIRNALRSAAEAVLFPEAGKLALVDPAEVPKERSGPPVVLMTMMAGLAGALSAAVVCVLWDTFRDTVDNEERLRELVGFPHLGTVTAFRGRGDGAVGAEAVATSPAGDGYRLLAAKIGLFRDPPKLSRVTVTGAEDSSESGSVALGLAAVVAAAGTHVTLVDADSARHQVTALVGSERQSSQLELPNGSRSVDEVSLEAAHVAISRNLDLVSIRGGNESMVEGAAVKAVFDALRASGSGLILVTSPPVNRSSTGFAWLEAADLCLLVIRCHHSPAAVVADAGQTLALSGTTVAGTVMTDGRMRLPAMRPSQGDPRAAPRLDREGT